MLKKLKKVNSGFIVHPFETGNRKFHASYGNHNRTVRSFKTLGKAKAYLKSKGIKKGIYDNPRGVRDFKFR